VREGRGGSGGRNRVSMIDRYVFLQLFSFLCTDIVDNIIKIEIFVCQENLRQNWPVYKRMRLYPNICAPEVF
jgi:hypothetical protein